jgi:hypothetical protein
MTFDGKAYNDCFMNHADLIKGGHIVFEMGSEPSTWGTESEPKSLCTGTEIPNPAEDLVAGRVKIRTEAFTPAGSSGLYTSGIKDGAKLFDNTSATNVTLPKGAAIVWSKKSGTALKMITLTCATSGKAPSSFKLEASNDGNGWITIDSRDISFEFSKFTRAFAVPAETAGIYCYYRLTFADGGQLAEVEFLGEDAKDEALTPITPTVYDDQNQGGEDETPTQKPSAPGTVNPEEEKNENGWLIPVIVIAIGAGLVAAILLARALRKKKQ